MNLSITETKKATDQQWENIWKECDYATYFQSREWAEIWRISSEGKLRPFPRLITFSDGCEALLPLSEQKLYKGLVRQYISSPAGTYGGWIGREELSIDHTILLANYCQDELPNLFLFMNPYTPNIGEIDKKHSTENSTHTLNLSQGFDAIYKNWMKGNGSIPRKARKALKEGVCIKMASTLEEWKIYYQVYQSSLLRWGKDSFSGYQWKLFEEIFNRHSPNIELWLAIYQDQIVAGSLLFYAKRHVVYWSGAALGEYFSLRPVNLLLYDVIKNSCERGYIWFDFNPSGGQEGVKSFKKSFGAEEIFFPVYSQHSKVIEFLKKIRSMVTG